MNIRDGDLRDISALQEIEKQARCIYADEPGFGFVAAMPPIAAERLASGTLLVAEIERTPAGFALTQLLDGALYLANVSVSPRAARRGIGAALLQGVVANAVRRHANAVTLTTFREPRWNGPWFRKHNFTEMPAAEIGPGLDAVLKRHASFLDMTWRETLWFRLDIVEHRFKEYSVP